MSNSLIRKLSTRMPVAAAVAIAGRQPPPLFEQIADVRTLLAAFRRIRAAGGRAAGPSGIGPRDIGDAEAADLFRAVRPRILAGTWRPGMPRTTTIPKADGRPRTIRVADPVDRAVAAATHAVLAPVWDATFADLSHGFRPGRSHLTALAAVVAAVENTGAFVVVAADAAGAFDHLRLGPVDRAHDAFFAREPRLVAFLRGLVRGHEPGRVVGIDQGSAYSPVVLNAVLDRYHDRPVEQAGDADLVAAVRYADDFTYVVRTPAAGGRVRDRLVEWLRPLGLAVKPGTGTPVDVRDGPARVLGFEVRAAGGGVRVGPGPAAWAALDRALGDAAAAADPLAVGAAVVRGWMGSLGPAALADGDIARAAAIVAGHDQPPVFADTLGRWHRQAVRRWERALGAARIEPRTRTRVRGL